LKAKRFTMFKATVSVGTEAEETHEGASSENQAE
jgi:hypothetical protein